MSNAADGSEADRLPVTPREEGVGKPRARAAGIEYDDGVAIAPTTRAGVEASEAENPVAAPFPATPLAVRTGDTAACLEPHA